MHVSAAPLAGRIAGLVDELDSSAFRKREKASREIAALGELALPDLQSALTRALPEQRERINALIPKAEAVTPERLRATRACEILEGVGNVDAKALLAVWAKGPSGATLTREATESLERLKSRGKQ
jgi:hypothetical protein